MPARLLLLCLLLRSSWLAAEGDRQVGAATVLHRRGGRAAVAVSVGVGGGVPLQNSRAVGHATSGLLLLGESGHVGIRGLIVCCVRRVDPLQALGRAYWTAAEQLT
jgi:hypothetical protein